LGFGQVSFGWRWSADWSKGRITGTVSEHLFILTWQRATCQSSLCEAPFYSPSWPAKEPTRRDVFFFQHVETWSGIHLNYLSAIGLLLLC
jgi:hypothetical protein